MPYRVNEPVDGSRPVIGDEQLKRMLNESTPGFFERNRFRIVTLVLIVVNVAVFAAEVLLSGMRFDVPTRTLVDMGAMYAPYVQAGELWRLVTPMFLHMDLMHLGFNMVALYSVGEVLERVLGRGSFLLLYFVGGHHGQRGVLRGRRRARRRALGERRRFDERVRPVRGGARCWGFCTRATVGCSPSTAKGCSASSA